MENEDRWEIKSEKERERVDPIDMGAPLKKTKGKAEKVKPPQAVADFSLKRIKEGIIKDIAVQLKTAALVSDAYAYVAALFAFASCLENTFRFQIGRDSLAHEALSVYLLLVGPPRRARKSTLIGSNVQRLVGEIVGRAFIDEFTSEAIHEELCVSETRSLNLYFDEFRSLVGARPSYAANLDTTITKMYNGEAWTRSIKGNKKKGELSTQRTITDFMVNVCGCTTAAWMFNNIERESFLSGFLLRFIPVHAREDDPAVRLNVDSPPEREAFLAGLPKVKLPALLKRLKAFHDVLMKAKSQVMVSLSPQASSLLAEYNKEMEPKKADDEIGNAILHGMTQNIRRVAALIQISRLADQAVKSLPRTLDVSATPMRESLSFFRTIYPQALRMIREHYHDSKQEANAKAHEELISSIERISQIFDEPAFTAVINHYECDTANLGRRILTEGEDEVKKADYPAAKAEYNRRLKFAADLNRLVDRAQIDNSMGALREFESKNGLIIWDLMGKSAAEIAGRTAYTPSVVELVLRATCERMLGAPLEEVALHGITDDEISSAVDSQFKAQEFRIKLDETSSIAVKVIIGKDQPISLVIGEEPCFTMEREEILERLRILLNIKKAA